MRRPGHSVVGVTDRPCATGTRRPRGNVPAGGGGTIVPLARGWPGRMKARLLASVLMTPRLVLWDIDGTLVRAGDLGAAVFDRALAAVLGRLPSERIRMSGKTDPQIVREYLELMEIGNLDTLPAVLRRLEVELAAAAHELAETGSVCPGAEDALAALSKEEGLTQSVLTGNIAPNAVVKLAAFGLERYLDLEAGAFGSDHADRRALVPIALARQEELHGRRLSAEDVWVVGDTPNDFACAAAARAHCVLVATGRYGVAELAPLGADAVLADLRDTDAVVELLAPPR